MARSSGHGSSDDPYEILKANAGSPNAGTVPDVFGTVREGTSRTTSSAAPVDTLPPDLPRTSWAVNSDKNWQGTTALVLGCIGIGLPGLIFGMLALQSVRDGRATNRGVALAGTIVSAVTMILGFVLLSSDSLDETSSSSGPGSGGLTLMADIQVGDCYLAFPGRADNEEYFEFEGFDVVSCTTPHRGEVYFRGQFYGDTYPGDDPLWADIEDRCADNPGIDDVADYKGVDLYLEYFGPTPQSWRWGERTYVCAVFDLDGSLTESVLSSP